MNRKSISDQKIIRLAMFAVLAALLSAILIARLLAAYFEISVSIATMISVLSLAALSAGACFQGFLPFLILRKLKWFFIGSAAGVSIILSPLFIYLFFIFMRNNVSANIGLAAAALLVFAMIILFMQGAVIRLLFQYVRLRAGNSALTFYLKNLTIFLGLIGIMVYSMTLLSVSVMVFINALFYLIAALILLDSFSREVISLSLMTSIMLVSFGANVQAGDFVDDKINVTFSAPAPISPLPKLSALADKISRQINAHKNFHDILAQLLFNILDLQHKQILILGDSDLRLSLRDHQHNRFTYADIAASHLPSACDYLSMLNKGNIIYLEQNRIILARKYDVVVAKMNQRTARNPENYFQEIYQMLTGRGLAILKISLNSEQDQALRENLENSLNAVFSDCLKFSLQSNRVSAKTLYVCQR